MIRLENLRKEYKQGNNTVEALKNINLSLPDTGLVFVLGKSGSGKSTLLNMLGLLDDITSGDILLNEVSLSKLNSRELDVYRSDYISVIYQNFNLFDSDLVSENVLVGARLLDEDKETIDRKLDDILKKLDLEEKKNTPVKNLSGGQKQRVAIARALMKNSEILLADEPTGNLDTKNTRIIFDILKDISKDKLVIVVSHDVKSAEAYADRIISLSDGEVYKDEVVNEKYHEREEGEIEIPDDVKLDEKNLKKINTDLDKHNLKLVKKEEKYVPFDKEVETKKEKPVFNKKHKTAKESLALSWSFFKNSKASFIVTLFVASLLIALLVLARNFTFYDKSSAIKLVNQKYDSRAYVANKAYSYYDDTSKINTSYLINIDEDDKQKFIDGGYKGNIYEMYMYSLNIKDGWQVENFRQPGEKTYNEFYSKEGLGVAVVDTNYLKNVFGNYNLLAGTLYDMDDEDETRLIVTDYFADSILYFDDVYSNGEYVSDDPHDPYQKIVNVKLNGRYTIAAIIETGYKEKYEKLIESFTEIRMSPQNARELYKELLQRDDLVNFLLDADEYLNIAYSINPKFKEAVIKYDPGMYYSKLQNMIVSDDKGNVITNLNNDAYIRSDEELEKGEMYMNILAYNELFGKALTVSDTSDFEEKNIVLRYYRFNQDVSKDEPCFTMAVKVIGVKNYNGSSKNNIGALSEEDYNVLQNEYVVPFALVFDDPSQAYLLNDIGIDNYFYTKNSAYKAAYTISDVVSIFSNIMGYVGAIIILIIVINIVTHSTRVIKKNNYQIGIYRSIGYPAKTIIIASILNTLYLILSVFLLSWLFSASSAIFVNSVIRENFVKYLKFSIANELVFVKFSLPILGIYMALILVIQMLTIAIPINSIRKLKPNKILYKAVE